MKLIPSIINGCALFVADRYEDDRGSFNVVWEDSSFNSKQPFKPSSANYAHNRKKHTLRGMHFQNTPFEQAKFVACTQGSIYDVIVDMRPTSLTYLSWEGFELSAERGGSLYISKGCAHGYLTLVDDTIVSYLIEGTYNADASAVLKWDDARIGIKWPGEAKSYIISQRDQAAPLIAL